MLTPDPVASSHDRLGFTVIMALLAHAAVILGVGFATEDPGKREGQSRLEITLAHHKSDEAPLQADFLAQHNQLASGTADTKKELLTTRDAAFLDDKVRDTDPLPSQMPQQTTTPVAKNVITRRGNNSQGTHTVTPPDSAAAQQQAVPIDTLSREIASLEARLSESLQSDARRPRTHRITSVASRSEEDADYLFDWQQRIERIGNQHYPEDARRNRIFGDLRLLVAINADGSVREIKIMQSSGKSVLDTAAIRIVKMAAPFSPFPSTLRKTTDVIEIIRTWQFQQNGLTSRQ
jgi:periplasmic protein TonB